MTFLKILVLAVVQGVCELLPVSCSAHVILAEKLMGLDPTAPSARSDDGGAWLGRFELAPGGVLESSEGIGTEVGKRVTLEPSPKEFDRVQIGRIAEQEVKLNATLPLPSPLR